MKPKTTKQKGLGWRHEQAVAELRRRHRDGSPCAWCGRPLYLNPVYNWDYDPQKPRRGNGVLQGDHSVQTRSEALRRGERVLPPDRLLHAECNRQRGAGGNDHLAAASRTVIDPEGLAMPWPWMD